MLRKLYILVLIMAIMSNYYIYNRTILPTANAQSLNGIVINTEPEFPIPGSAVTLKMETFQFDSDIANISWYYNGKLIESGIGKKNIEITYPSLGETAQVRVVASINSEQNYVGGRLLGGATVNLLYEPINSYTPAWYEGSALPSEGGEVKLYAEAYLYSNKTRIPPENLIYNWTIDEEPQTKLSGLGKSTANITLDPIVGEAYVQLTVKSVDGIFETRAAARVTPNKPDLRIYYNNYDVFPRVLPNYYNFNTNETILSAEPFHAWIDNRNRYTWSINSVPNINTGKTFPIRRSDNSAGQVNLDLYFENKGMLYQYGQVHGIINFDK